MKIPEVAEIYKHGGDESLVKKPYQKLIPTQEMAKLAAEMLAYKPSLKYNLDKCANYTSFFRVEPDLRHESPENWQPSLFFLLKKGYFYEGIPCEWAEIIEWLDSTYGTLNALANACEDEFIHKLFTGNDNCDYTYFQAAEIVTGREFAPITEYKYKVPNGNLFDVYVESTDRVALMCPELANKLEHTDIESISVVNKYLCIGPKTLVALLGGVGAAYGIYDLSRVL